MTSNNGSNKSSPAPTSSYDSNTTVKPTSSSSGFISRKLSSKRDRSNSTSRNRPSPPPPPPSLPSYTSQSSSTSTNLQMKYSVDNNDEPFSPSSLPPASAFGKARDRSTFKGVIDKFVGSFNGKSLCDSVRVYVD